MRKHLARAVFTLATLLALGFILSGVDNLGAAPPDEPVRLRFDSTRTANIWQGPVDGAFTGRLTAVVHRSSTTGVIAHVDCACTVDAGASSFVAALSGIFSTETGIVVMNGMVTDGFLKGAQVHLEARLVSIPERFRVVGTLRIMPATAG